MADVTRTIHLKVSTWDPVAQTMIPVPNAKVLVEDSGWLWDPNLSSGDDTTNAAGEVAVAITFDAAKENSLNPYFTVTIPIPSRALPPGAAADRQIHLPGEWETGHSENHRVRRIGDFTDPAKPLEIFVGLDAHLRVSYSDDFRLPAPDKRAIRNPMAVPEDGPQVHLADRDTLFFIDALNPDDTLKGFGADRAGTHAIRIGSGDRYPYFEKWPVAPWAGDGVPATPRAWIDPPGAPVATLGGGSFGSAGAIAVDRHGFTFVADGNEIRRCYPDGTLAETVVDVSLALKGAEGLAVDSARRLYVADAASNEVRVFRLGWGDGDDGLYSRIVRRGGFNAPHGVAVIPHPAVDGEEILAIADTGSHSVQLLRIAVGNNARLLARSLVPLLGHSAFGTVGNGVGQFQEPIGMAADRQRRLYVCDRALHRVSRWIPNAAGTAWTHDVDFEKAGGGAGAGDGEFDTPVGIAVDLKNEWIYVAEEGNRRVQRLDMVTGAHLAHWTPVYSGAVAHPFTPSGVAVDERGDVYVTDGANARVVHGSMFDAGGAAVAANTVPRIVGVPWTPHADFSHMREPHYVTFGKNGELLVADTGNDRVMRFSPGPSGALSLSSTPMTAGMTRPAGVAVDDAGTIFVTDSGNNRIVRFSAIGVVQSAFGAAGSGNAEFDDPRGITVVQRNEPLLYVADRQNNRVQALKRDGTFVAQLSAGGAHTLKLPQDVAADSTGQVFVADTGNKRIVQYDAADAFVREITLVGSGESFSLPTGIAVDEEDKLLVTDRSSNKVYRLDTAGKLLAFWDFNNLVRRDDGGDDFFPDLARQLRLDSPTRADSDGHGLLAIADTGSHRVRLTRTYTDLHVALLDLGEQLPDISLRAAARAGLADELGRLHVEVTDVGFFCDDVNEISTSAESDFGKDHYERRHILDAAHDMNAATNVMRTVRTAQRWLMHVTRQEEEGEWRWGVGDRSGRKLLADLSDEKKSQHEWGSDVIELSSKGARSDAWSEGTVIHEMAHWIFDKSVHPFPPFAKVGADHELNQIMNQNEAITEGFADYLGLFWDADYGSSDPVRGFPLAGGTTLTDLSVSPAILATHRYLVGGPLGVSPTFDDPEAGLRNEGYFANASWQIHHMLADSDIRWADAPSFWYGYNAFTTDEQSRLYTRIMRRALRMFPERPAPGQFSQGSSLYFKSVLERAHAESPPIAELTRAILELNNQLLPHVVVTEGASATAAGTAIPGAAMDVVGGATRNLVVQLLDATNRPVPRASIRFVVGAAAEYAAAPGPAARHGRRALTAPPATELYGVTNDSGIVNVAFTPAAVAAGTAPAAQTMRVEYQPDFDIDAAFSPPERADDRDTTMRRLYMHALRDAAKTWTGVGNNFGAIVASTVTFTVRPA